VKAGFEDAGYPYEQAYVLATVCFFAGIVLGKFFNWLAHWVRELIAQMNILLEFYAKSIPLRLEFFILLLVFSLFLF
jgi:hypothetical protein